MCEQGAIGSQQVRQPTRAFKRLEIGRKRGQVLRRIAAGQPATGQERGVGVERIGEGGEVGRNRQAGEIVRIAAFGQKAEIGSVELRPIGEKAAADSGPGERGQIVADALLAQFGIGRRDAASGEIGVIGIQRLRIAGKDIGIQAGEAVDLPAIVDEGEIVGEETGPVAEETHKRPGLCQLREVGAQPGDIATGILRRQAATRKEGEIGVQLRGVAGENIRIQPGEAVDLPAIVHEGEVVGEEPGPAAEETLERPGLCQSREIGAQLGDIAARIVRRQAATRKEGEIGAQLRGVAGINVRGEGSVAIDRATAAQESEIVGKEGRPLAQNGLQQSRIRQRLQIGLQGRLIDRAIGTGQPPARQKSEIVAERGLILACEGQPAVLQIGGKQGLIRGGELLRQTAFDEERDRLAQRVLAGGGEIGGSIAGADEGEEGFGQIGEGARETVGISAARDEGQIGLRQHPVARGQIAEAAGALDEGQIGIDIGRAGTRETRRQAPGAQQIEITQQEARIGCQEVRAGAALRQKAQIAADDVRLGSGKGRSAETGLKATRCCDQQRQIAAREGLDRRIGCCEFHAPSGGDDVARGAGCRQRIAQRDGNAVQGCASRSGLAAKRRDLAGCRVTAIAIGLALRADRHDQLRPVARARPPHFPRIELSQIVCRADPDGAGQRVAARLAILGDREAARGAATRHPSFEPFGHADHDFAPLGPGDGDRAAIKVDRAIAVDREIGAIHERCHPAAGQAHLQQPLDPVHPLAFLEGGFGLAEKHFIGQRRCRQRQPGRADQQGGSDPQAGLRRGERCDGDSHD